MRIKKGCCFIFSYAGFPLFFLGCLYKTKAFSETTGLVELLENSEQVSQAGMVGDKQAL